MPQMGPQTRACKSSSAKPDRATQTSPTKTALLDGVLEAGGRLFDHGSLVSEHFGNRVDRFFRPAPLLLLDRFSQRRHRLHSVAGIKAGSVKLMLEPRTARQTVRVGQSAFALEQLEVHLCERGSSQRGPALLSRLCIHPLIVIGALVESIQRVLQGSKIQVRRHCQRPVLPPGKARAAWCGS